MIQRLRGVKGINQDTPAADCSSLHSETVETEAGSREGAEKTNDSPFLCQPAPGTATRVRRPERIKKSVTVPTLASPTINHKDGQQNLKSIGRVAGFSELWGPHRPTRLKLERHFFVFYEYCCFRWHNGVSPSKAFLRRRAPRREVAEQAVQTSASPVSKGCADIVSASCNEPVHASG